MYGKVGVGCLDNAHRRGNGVVMGVPGITIRSLAAIAGAQKQLVTQVESSCIF